jgi:hypothetical protein
VPEVDHPKLDRFAFLRKRGLTAPDYRDTTTGKLRIPSDNALAETVFEPLCH